MRYRVVAGCTGLRAVALANPAEPVPSSVERNVAPKLTDATPERDIASFASLWPKASASWTPGSDKSADAGTSGYAGSEKLHGGPCVMDSEYHGASEATAGAASAATKARRVQPIAHSDPSPTTASSYCPVPPLSACAARRRALARWRGLPRRPVRTAPCRCS